MPDPLQGWSSLDESGYKALQKGPGTGLYGKCRWEGSFTALGVVFLSYLSHNLSGIHPTLSVAHYFTSQC